MGVADCRLYFPSQLIPTLLMNFDMELAEPEATWTETCRYAF